MFDRIMTIRTLFLQARERRANIRYFSSLDDRLLRDIGLERYDIAAFLDSAAVKAQDTRQASVGAGLAFCDADGAL